MKRKKNFTAAKILLIFIGCLSCLGTVLISQTLSTYYTSYSFINKFISPKSESGSAVSVYRVGSPLETITDHTNYPCAFHIKNEGTVQQYIRAAITLDTPDTITEGLGSEVGGALEYAVFMRSSYVIVWDGTNGLFNSNDYGEDSSYVNTKKWIIKGPWLYLKTPLAKDEDMQLSTALCFPSGIEGAYTLDFKLIVEALPADADDNEFQSTWGVSKTELETLGLGQEETAS